MTEKTERDQPKRDQPMTPDPPDFRVWIECPQQAAPPRSLKEALGPKAQEAVHMKREYSAGRRPSSIVLCPNDQDVGSELRRLRSLAPGVPLLVFSDSSSEELLLPLARRALREGAHGLLLGGMSAEQLVRALASASQREVVIPEGLLEDLAEASAGGGAATMDLTPRQREVLELVARNALSDAQVAKRLSLPEGTVKRELHAAYRTLRYNRKIQEAILARRSKENEMTHPDDVRGEDA